MKDYEKPILKRSKEVKVVKKILKELKIKHRFYWNHVGVSASGYAKPVENIIFAYTRFPNKERYEKQEFLSTVFHEIQHILSSRQNIYVEYNNGLFAKRANQSIFNVWAKQLLKAERFCDKEGAKMMGKYFPKVPFVESYTGYRGRWLAKQYIQYTANEFGLKVPKNA